MVRPVKIHDYDLLRDRVLDFLFRAAPCLLDDEELVEALVYVCWCEAQRATVLERRRQEKMRQASRN
jgi:hypothetical protein